ncbi:MAG: hypothetical protein QM219_02385 [Bacillota bacterium]|jgi:hypothetical protein|nr:hypothetical protein [Bacillota bacterium]
MLRISKENVVSPQGTKKPTGLDPGGFGKGIKLLALYNRRMHLYHEGPVPLSATVHSIHAKQQLSIGRGGKSHLLFKQSRPIAVVVHIAGCKGLGYSQVGIQQLLLQFADFVIYIILMGRKAEMFLKKPGKMGLAETGHLGRFFGIEGFQPVAFYVLLAPENFFLPPVYIFEESSMLLMPIISSAALLINTAVPSRSKT